MSKHEYRGDRDGEMMVVGSKLGFGLAFAVIMLAEEKPTPALLVNQTAGALCRTACTTLLLSFSLAISNLPGSPQILAYFLKQVEE